MMHRSIRPLSRLCTSFQCRYLNVEQGEWNVWLSRHRIGLNDAMTRFAESKNDDAEAMFIDDTNWKAFINKFRRDFITDPVSLSMSDDEFQVVRNIAERFTVANPQENILGLRKSEKAALFDIISKNAAVALKDVIVVNKALATATDMSVPHTWYPVTRIMKRKIIYHGGPTNSGKVSSLLHL